MSVQREGDRVRLVGRCGAEDAETLLAHLAAGVRRVDVSGCEQLHAAILQLLLAGSARIEGEAPDFLVRWKLLPGDGAEAAP